MSPGALPQRFRLGPAELDRYLAGQLSGLAYMRRLRAIEDDEARHLRELESAWLALAEEVPDPDAFALAWREAAPAGASAVSTRSSPSTTRTTASRRESR